MGLLEADDVDLLLMNVTADELIFSSTLKAFPELNQHHQQ